MWLHKPGICHLLPVSYPLERQGKFCARSYTHLCGHLSTFQNYKSTACHLTTWHGSRNVQQCALQTAWGMLPQAFTPERVPCDTCKQAPGQQLLPHLLVWSAKRTTFWYVIRWGSWWLVYYSEDWLQTIWPTNQTFNKLGALTISSSVSFN